MIIQKNKGKVVQENGATKEKFRMVAKTMVSLEEVLADELRQMGAENVTVGARAVEFEGDMRLLYRANYCCRTALAILKPFAEFDANDDQELYDQVYRIRWEKILDVDCTFMIDSTTSGEVFTHSYYAALKTKDAIVDRFRRNFGKRPNIDTENPDYKFNLHIRDNHVTLLMNSSGDSLHKRGYRQGVGVAPINEVLAAGLLYLAGWTQAIKQSNNQAVNFYDPMCGSGTMLIEAAMMANNIPAQYYRGNRFGFMRWKEFNLGEWKSVKAEEDRKIGALDFEGEIWGNDIDEQVIQQCEKNLEYTKLHKDVMLHIGDFADQEPPEGKTLIVTNPPYGERIKVEDLNAMYEKLGDTFKKFGSRKSEVRDNADDSSNLRPSTSDLRPSTSDLRPSTSDLRPSTSDLRPSTSDLRPSTSDLRPSTSDLRPPTSDLDLWLITSDFEAMKHIGLHPSRKIPVQNGSLDCRFLHFELYDGSKKASKNS